MQTKPFKHVNKLGKDLVIFNNGHHVDVFFGSQGWDTCARFQKKKSHKGIFISQISGSRVPAAIFKQVLQEVTQ